MDSFYNLISAIVYEHLSSVPFSSTEGVSLDTLYKLFYNFNNTAGYNEQSFIDFICRYYPGLSFDSGKLFLDDKYTVRYSDVSLERPDGTIINHMNNRWLIFIKDNFYDIHDLDILQLKEILDDEVIVREIKKHV